MPCEEPGGVIWRYKTYKNSVLLPSPLIHSFLTRSVSVCVMPKFCAFLYSYNCDSNAAGAARNAIARHSHWRNGVSLTGPIYLHRFLTRIWPSLFCFFLKPLHILISYIFLYVYIYRFILYIYIIYIYIYICLGRILDPKLTLGELKMCANSMK